MKPKLLSPLCKGSNHYHATCILKQTAAQLLYRNAPLLCCTSRIQQKEFQKRRKKRESWWWYMSQMAGLSSAGKRCCTD